MAATEAGTGGWRCASCHGWTPWGAAHVCPHQTAVGIIRYPPPVEGVEVKPEGHSPDRYERAFKLFQERAPYELPGRDYRRVKELLCKCWEEAGK